MHETIYRFYGWALPAYRPAPTQKAGRQPRGLSYRSQGSRDYRQVRAHRVVALLDSQGKLVEKTAAHLITDQLERKRKLHEGQYGSRRRRSCVDAVAVLISSAQKAWSRKNVAGALLMDVNSAFNNVSRGAA